MEVSRTGIRKYKKESHRNLNRWFFGGLAKFIGITIAGLIAMIGVIYVMLLIQNFAFWLNGR